MRDQIDSGGPAIPVDAAEHLLALVDVLARTIDELLPKCNLPQERIDEGHALVAMTRALVAACHRGEDVFRDPPGSAR